MIRKNEFIFSLNTMKNIIQFFNFIEASENIEHVQLINSIREVAKTRHGVPQGTVLGPQFLIIYI